MTKQQNNDIALESTASPEPNEFRQSCEKIWPIWHLLSHSEQKKIAKEHGFENNIGSFEQSMTLSVTLSLSNRNYSDVSTKAKKSILLILLTNEVD